MEHAVASPQLSSEHRQMIFSVLKSVLDSRHFCKSKRYPALLEFAVLAALEESPAALKERTVGVEVFGRQVGYDTSTDPVVRIAMGEVRRRVALYFSEHPQTPVRIDLPVGSYKAEFHFRPLPATEDSLQGPPAQMSVPAGAQDPQVSSVEVWRVPVNSASAVSKPRRTINWRWTRPQVVFPAMLVCIVAGLGVWRHLEDRGRRDFWWPVLHGDRPALILVGKQNTPVLPDTAAGQQQMAVDGPARPPNLVLDDAIVAAQVCGVFREYGRNCNIAPAVSEKVEDIRGKSVVLVGGFNNPWTLRLLERLRYQIQFEQGTRDRVVVEHKPTGDIPLGRVGREPLSDKDYAIVARFRSDITDDMAVVVAGLGIPGTSSAGQYAASPEKLSEILAKAPSDWKGINFESVLQIDVVQGSAGHVEVIATHFW
jgi:hypothetical protein